MIVDIKHFSLNNRLTLEEIVEDELYNQLLFMYTRLLKSSKHKRLIKTPVVISEVNKLKDDPKDNEYVVQFYELDEDKPVNDDGSFNHKKIHTQNALGKSLPHISRINLDGIMKVRKGMTEITSYFDEFNRL